MQFHIDKNRYCYLYNNVKHNCRNSVWLIEKYEVLYGNDKNTALIW